MCFYRSGTGNVYSDITLKFRGFLIAKRKYPNLSVNQYREKLSEELGGLDKMPFNTVSELCANGMPEDAAMLYARNNNCPMGQARLVVSLLLADGRC